MSRIEPMKNKSRRMRRGAYDKRRAWRPPPGGEEMGFYGAHRGCMDKTTFRSRKTVRNAARRLGLGYYRCDFCGLWHLTKNLGGEDVHND